MSGDKPPVDPFPRTERTVIRPNPGGRREPSAPGPPPGGDIWGTGTLPPQSAPPPAPARVEPRPEVTPPAPSAHPAGQVNFRIVDFHVPDGNIIMRAARPLMVLLSNLRITAISQVSGPLMDDVASAIAAFERELRIAGLPDSQTIAAKYTLCATADDIVQNLPGADRQLWTQYSMLSRFFQIRTSGVGFFEELAKMKANPALNCDLLELMHACLSLGFEGQYRTAGGDVALQQIRRDLYQTIRHIRSRPEDEISPHWRGQDIAPEHERVAVPVWAVSAIAAGLLLAVFIALRLLLSSSSGALADRLATLHPDTPVELAREPFSPLPPMPPKSTQLERIRAALAVDIKANRVSVDPAGKDILIKLLDDVLFDRGSATIKSGFAEALKHIAETLNKEPNRILVVGHTDSTALKSTVKFKDNQDLSEKRALAVAEMLRPDLTDHDRIDIAGRGDTEPAASNKTEEGRSRNRRVEIRIPRID